MYTTRSLFTTWPSCNKAVEMYLIINTYTSPNADCMGSLSTQGKINKENHGKWLKTNRHCIMVT